MLRRRQGYKNIKWLLMVSILFITTSGCNNDENRDDYYILNQLQTLEEGQVIYFDLTGIDSNGRSFAGSIEIVNSRPEMVVGVLATLRSFMLDITDQDLPTIFPLFQDNTQPRHTTYVLDDTGLLVSLLENIGYFCTNTSPDKLPSIVKAGDEGVLTPLNCTGDWTRNRSWRVDSVEGVGIRLNITHSDVDSNGAITSITDYGYIIDKNNEIVGFDVDLDISGRLDSDIYRSRLFLHSAITR